VVFVAVSGISPSLVGAPLVGAHSSFYIPGSAGFQPATSYAKCGLEARAPRPTGHEMAEDSEM
jgi:hypothetical protein